MVSDKALAIAGGVLEAACACWEACVSGRREVRRPWAVVAAPHCSL